MSHVFKQAHKFTCIVCDGKYSPTVGFISVRVKKICLNCLREIEKRKFHLLWDD